MKLTRGWFHLAALAGLAAVVGGCSSGGVQGPVATGSSAASRQFAAALFVQEWGQILWGMVTSQTSTELTIVGDPVFNPDGSVSQTITAPDGTVGVVTIFPDGSARLEITFPNGVTEVVKQSPLEFDGVSKTTLRYRVTSSDGLNVAYTAVIDNSGTPLDSSDDITESTGRSTLGDGQTQDFAVTAGHGQTTLQSTQSDGSTFALAVPLAAPDFAFPDFSRPTTGTYGIGNLTARFTLSTAAQPPSRWDTMSSDLGGGVSGQFSLNPDLSGSGQLMQNGQLSALLSWTRTGETQVSFLTAERSDTAPAGAAVDFLVHRWLTLTALMGPTPGGRSRTCSLGFSVTGVRAR